MVTETTRPIGAVVLTREGRERLSRRLVDLDSSVLPQLQERIWSKDRDWNDDLALASALSERRSIRSAMAVSVDAESIPDDPDVVELGDFVAICDEHGHIETYRIVDPVEAPLDDIRVSSTSPLAQAVLGGRVGDDITIAPPLGLPRRYRVVDTWRIDQPDVA